LFTAFVNNLVKIYEGLLKKGYYRIEENALSKRYFLVDVIRVLMIILLIQVLGGRLFHVIFLLSIKKCRHEESFQYLRMYGMGTFTSNKKKKCKVYHYIHCYNYARKKDTYIFVDNYCTVTEY
jgi:hypothetical protein